MIPVGSKVRVTNEELGFSNEVVTVSGVLTGGAVTHIFNEAPDPCYFVTDSDGKTFERIAESEIALV